MPRRSFREQVIHEIMQARSEWAGQRKYGEGASFLRAQGAISACDDLLARIRALEDDDDGADGGD